MEKGAAAGRTVVEADDKALGVGAAARVGAAIIGWHFVRTQRRRAQSAK